MKNKKYILIQFYDYINNDYKIIYESENKKILKRKLSFLIETNKGKNKRYKIIELS